MDLIEVLRCQRTASEKCEGECQYLCIDDPGWAQVKPRYFCNVARMVEDAANEIEKLRTENKAAMEACDELLALNHELAAREELK